MEGEVGGCKLTFGHVLGRLKSGDTNNASREGWNGKGLFISIQRPDRNSKMTFPYLVMHIPECKEGNRIVPWQPSQVDMFTDDWQIN